MRIALAQINTVPGAFDQVVERMVAQTRRAAEQGADLVVFPLAALAGVEDLPYPDIPAFLHDVADALVSMADRFACPAIVPVPADMGMPSRSFDAIMIDNGDLRFLGFSTRTDAGARSHVDVPEFDLCGMRAALALSQDDLDTLCDYDYDVDVVLYISGYPFALDDPASAMGADLGNARFESDAQSIGAWLVGCAPVGGYGDQVFTGSSFVLAPSGNLVALAPAFEEALLVADLDADATDGVEPLFPEMFDVPFHLWQTVSLGIHDYATKQGRTDVALCLDGSLASSVLAALASDAVGPLHVHALVGASAGGSAPACRELAKRLHIDQRDAAGQPRGFDARDLDELELAALAREQDALVLAPYDKTGLALGAYGRHVSCAELCPLGDVYRSDVLDMAHVRNTISPLFRRVGLSESEVLSLTLADGSQFTAASEADVVRLDEILSGYVEYDRPLAELVAASDDGGALVQAVLKAERLAEPWRRTLPPVLAMTTHTLDDARFPLGVSWHDTHLDDLTDAALGSMLPAPKREDVPNGEDHPPKFDLDGTLAMLRDIAEQGGLLPPGFTPTGKVPGGFDGGMGSDGKPLGWLNPFSEN